MNFGVVDFKNSVEFSMFINLAGEVTNFIELSVDSCLLSVLGSLELEINLESFSFYLYKIPFPCLRISGSPEVRSTIVEAVLSP